MLSARYGACPITVTNATTAAANKRFHLAFLHNHIFFSYRLISSKTPMSIPGGRHLDLCFTNK